MRIDAHQHFWKFDPVRDAWITEDMKVLRKDFMPTDLEPILKRHQIDGCVAVQADQSEKETKFLLDLAANNQFIRKVVGWVDLSAPNVEERLEALQSHQKLAGFRHILQAEPPEKMADRPFRNGISRLEACGYTYDILIHPDHLPATLDFVDAFPNQLFVIDHLAKPVIREKRIEPWKKLFGELARREHVYCKLSGLVTEADLTRWKPEDLLPYLDHALEAFGPTRVMYGSDWPVCLLAASYDRAIGVIDQYVNQLSRAEREKVMGGTASHFYRIAN